MDEPFYFAATIIIILIIAVILFQGFNRAGIVLLLILSISLWKLYKELYSNKLPSNKCNT